ncbi:hypothetical protein CspeluHIS016_0309110 [Cutaneotrichosporon spelunceum]|uniref:Ricin B lectin domain-containing protein n=1 Tax=Cutaneotrichosporon spelunceum TaxID=1672016 RepID=A0AAD3TUC2_9TREE|nr:hypothetical protein CspeluHIS016_0309110 [Cutaneotrichosporon spelunceum]
MLGVALTLLGLVAAAPTPGLERFHPNGSPTFCLSAIDGGYSSVDGCGMGLQSFELAGKQLRQTSGGYNMCVFPEREASGARITGAVCKDEHSHWAPGPRKGTIAWKGFWCLDNAWGKLSDGNSVEIWRCSEYDNSNQVWTRTPAPADGWM